MSVAQCHADAQQSRTERAWVDDRICIAPGAGLRRLPSSLSSLSHHTGCSDIHQLRDCDTRHTRVGQRGGLCPAEFAPRHSPRWFNSIPTHCERWTDKQPRNN